MESIKQSPYPTHERAPASEMPNEISYDEKNKEDQHLNSGRNIQMNLKLSENKNYQVEFSLNLDSEFH
jgi:hypothetical protein